MDDMKILDAVERYVRGEMNPDERAIYDAPACCSGGPLENDIPGL